jgi:hypothetical protein
MRVLILLLLCCAAAAAGDAPDKKTTIEVELDPYYSAVGVYNSLTGKPIPHIKADSELEIYRELVRKFYQPRTLVIEA